LKIHIVQKGDTLWEIAKKYDVDFEELKKLNSQLSSPDMIMPGMKVKIPSSTKTVKKEKMKLKEQQQPHAEHPYKDTSPKPLPMMEEDDHKKPKEVKVEMPTTPLPQMQEMPQMPKMPEIPVQQPVAKKEQTPPVPQIPQVSQPMEAISEQMPPMHPQPVQFVPVCCCQMIHHPCCPNMHPGHFPMGQMEGGLHQQGHHHMQQQQMMPPPPTDFGPVKHDCPPPKMEMPIKPMLPMETDCGCHSHPEFSPSMGYMTSPYAMEGMHESYPVHPEYNNMPEMGHHDLYPHQFGGSPLQPNNPNPMPPGYPNFSHQHYREEEEEPKGE